MKKILFLCFAFTIFASNLNAQEVHGVEITRKIIKEVPHNNGYADLYFGYEITNMNSIPVSIEIELYHSSCGDYKEGLVETKNITLQSKESYLWEPTFNIFGIRKPGENIFGIRTPGEIQYSDACVDCRHSAENCYVRYKAYKIL